MVEVFKFINVQSGSKKSERALFFRKNFKTYEEKEIEKWRKNVRRKNKEKQKKNGRKVEEKRKRKMGGKIAENGGKNTG